VQLALAYHAKGRVSDARAALKKVEEFSDRSSREEAERLKAEDTVGMP
jgi:hypothetical protein